jgi:hypothetical protein
MTYPDEELRWPHSCPEDIYLHLAESADGASKLSTQQSYQGHAVLRMCSWYDDASEVGPSSPVAERPFRHAPFNACGFTMEIDDHAIIFDRDFGLRIEGALKAALVRLYPERAGLLTGDRLDGFGSVIRSGMSANAAVQHPFFQGAVGLLPAEEHAADRLTLRGYALNESGLPPMGPETYRRVDKFLRRETGIHQDQRSLRSLWDWARDFLAADIVAQGRAYLRHAVFFSREDYKDLDIGGAPARRLRFLKFFPASEGLFTPSIPADAKMAAIRRVVQAPVSTAHRGTLFSLEEIDAACEAAIGHRDWSAFRTDPAGFIAERV